MQQLTTQQLTKPYYAYECRSGCGRITLTDKKYKTKRTICAVCGERTEMEYRGDYTLNKIPTFKQ